MPNKRSGKSKGMSQLAVDLLEEAVGEPPPITSVGKKNPVAVDLGRAGELEAGATRAAKVKVKSKAKAKVEAKVEAKGLAPRKRKA